MGGFFARTTRRAGLATARPNERQENPGGYLLGASEADARQSVTQGHNKAPALGRKLLYRLVGTFDHQSRDRRMAVPRFQRELDFAAARIEACVGDTAGFDGEPQFLGSQEEAGARAVFRGQVNSGRSLFDNSAE